MVKSNASQTEPYLLIISLLTINQKCLTKYDRFD